MARAFVLCVIFLVSKGYTMPLDSTKDGSEVDLGRVKSSSVTMNLLLVPMEDASRFTKVPFKPVESDSRILNEPLHPISNILVKRIKRAVIGNTVCPKAQAMIRWKGCVPCDEYMDYMDVDECPGDSRR